MPPYATASHPECVALLDTMNRKRYEKLPPNRPDYVPTPLDPDNIYNHEGVYYSTAVLHKVESLLEAHSESQPKWLRDFAFISLMGAVSTRFWHNRSALHAHEIAVKNGEVALDDTAELLLEKAKSGTADTNELLTLPLTVPSLPAVELAKMSHPFDWEATFEMDLEVYQALKQEEFNQEVIWFSDVSAKNNPGPVYSFKRADNPDNPNAIIIAKKEPVAIAGRELLVAHREAFIVQLNEEPGGPALAGISRQLAMDCKVLTALNSDQLSDDPSVQKIHRLAEEKILNRVGAAINQQLALDPPERAAWLSPTSSSYYSRKLKAEERRLLEVRRPAHGSLGSAAVFPHLRNQSA